MTRRDRYKQVGTDGVSKGWFQRVSDGRTIFVPFSWFMPSPTHSGTFIARSWIEAMRINSKRYEDND